LLYLPLQRLRPGLGVYHPVGHCFLAFQRHLGPDSQPGVILLQVVAGHQPPDLLSLAGPDDYHLVEPCLQAGLEQQGGDYDRNRVLAFPAHFVQALLETLDDGGVCQFVQPLPGIRVAEYDFCQGLSVGLAFACDALVAELAAQVSQQRAAARKDTPGLQVGIQNRNSLQSEESGDCAFSAGDSAGESDDEHGSACWASWPVSASESPACSVACASG